MTYPKRLDALAKKLKTDRKGALKGLLNWYDSYRFCPDSKVTVCNPISIANALETRIIRNYWAKTASASLVMDRIEAAHKSPADFDGCPVTLVGINFRTAKRNIDEPLFAKFLHR